MSYAIVDSTPDIWSNMTFSFYFQQCYSMRIRNLREQFQELLYSIIMNLAQPIHIILDEIKIWNHI